jgi:hypothetical protein
MFKTLKTRAALVAAAASLLATSAIAQTAPTTDYTSMTNQVNYSGAITALLAVGGVILGVVVVIKAIQWIISMVKRG